MNFSGELGKVSTKPAVPDSYDDNGKLKEGKPAVMTIQILVESPPDSLAGLLNRLANEGDMVRCELSGYQVELKGLVDAAVREFRGDTQRLVDNPDGGGPIIPISPQ